MSCPSISHIPCQHISTHILPEQIAHVHTYHVDICHSPPTPRLWLWSRTSCSFTLSNCTHIMYVHTYHVHTYHVHTYHVDISISHISISHISCSHISSLHISRSHISGSSHSPPTPKLWPWSHCLPRRGPWRSPAVAPLVSSFKSADVGVLIILKQLFVFLLPLKAGSFEEAISFK